MTDPKLSDWKLTEPSKHNFTYDRYYRHPLEDRAVQPCSGRDLPRMVYEGLRKLAATSLPSERPGQTLQATALVHEA